MALSFPCPACQDGMHDEHVDVPGPVAEGILGGWVCPCGGGECRLIEREPLNVIEITPELELQMQEAFAALDALHAAMKSPDDPERG